MLSNKAITTVHQAFKNVFSRFSKSKMTQEAMMRMRPTVPLSQADMPTRAQAERTFGDWARRQQTVTTPATTSMAPDKGTRPLPPPPVRGPDVYPARSWDPMKQTQKMDLTEFRKNLRRRKTDL